MTHSHLLNGYVLNFIPLNLNDLIITDVGCGYGEWGALLRRRRRSFYLIGVDIWKPHLIKLRKTCIYNELIQIDAPKLPFKDKSVNISLACEVLEHLNKEAGYELIKELERVSRDLVIISTPLNWPQEDIYGNPHEKHLSEWTPHELSNLDYKIKVIDVVVNPPRKLGFINSIASLILRHPIKKLVIAHKTFNCQ
ncbi:MAG: class I SAM-dependent methyltransferase [Candidatus Bathyarchaeia archaeon]